MNKFRFIVLFVALALCYSCSSSNRYAADVKVKACNDISKSLSEGEKSGLFALGDWPSDKWWDQFEDKDLSQLIDIALVENPSLNHVRMQVMQANQEAYIVRSKLFPQISASFSPFWTKYSTEGKGNLFPHIGSGEFHLYNLALNFAYTFDFWRKNAKLYEAALGVAQAQKMQEYQAKLVLSISLAKEYFNLKANILKLEYMREIFSNVKKQQELTNIRIHNRIDNLIDLNQMNEQVNQVEMAMAGLEGQIELEKHMINILIGKGPDNPIDTKEPWRWTKSRFCLSESIGSKLLERRPDLMAQLWQVKKNSLMVGVATAEFFPLIKLDATGGIENIEFQELFNGNDFTAKIEPEVNLPVFLGGKLRANVRAKVAALEASIYEFNDSYLKAINTVIDGMTDFTTVSEQLMAQQEKVSSAKSTLDLTILRYRHGIDSYLTKLNVEEVFLWEKVNEIEYQRKQSQEYLDLIMALGGGFKANEEETPKGVVSKPIEKDETVSSIGIDGRA